MLLPNVPYRGNEGKAESLNSSVVVREQKRQLKGKAEAENGSKMQEDTVKAKRMD